MVRVKTSKCSQLFASQVAISTKMLLLQHCVILQHHRTAAKLLNLVIYILASCSVVVGVVHYISETTDVM